jgi:uncharacterized membrane protein
MADRGVSKLSVAAIAAALACLLLAGSAAASTWTADQLPDGNVTGDLFGVSCPSQSFCVATGSNNTVATSGNPTGGVPAWNLFHIGPGSEVSSGSPMVTSPGQQLRGVSCPTAGYCVAASRQGTIYDSGNPAGGPGAWRETPIDSPGPNTHLYGISCPSLGLCVAVATEGRIVASTNPSSVAPAWTITQLPQPLELQGVSCASSALCVAVGKGGEILSSTDPTGGASAWKTVGGADFASLYGVSCPSPSLCVTGNAIDVFTSTDPLSGAWQAQSEVTPLRLMAFSCTPTLACAALNDNADVIASKNPTGGPDQWTFTNAVPYTEANGTFGISCPTEELCVGVGAHYLIISSTDAFTGGPGAAGRGHGLKRPTVRILKHPRKRIVTSERRVRVTFRFREIGVSGKPTVCKLDRGKYRRCRSPKSYRVGPGRHAFRVKVYDPAGQDQTPAVFKFKVLRREARGHGSGPARRTPSAPAPQR